MLRPMLLTLLACTDAADTGDTAAAAPDPATVLLELATEVTTHLYEAVYFAVGEDTLLAMEPDDWIEADLTFPDDADPDHWELDAALSAELGVLYAEEGDVRTWYWENRVEITTMALPSAVVSGSADWMVQWESYDSSIGMHVWSGTLSIDGAEEVPVSFGAWATWTTLNVLNGTVDGEIVQWENPEPDEP